MTLHSDAQFVGEGPAPEWHIGCCSPAHNSLLEVYDEVPLSLRAP